MSIRRMTAFAERCRARRVARRRRHHGRPLAAAWRAGRESAGRQRRPRAAACTVAVSWNNYQQPRWAKNDQPNIKTTVEAAGGTYIDADANLSNEQQLTDIDTLIAQGRQGPHPARPGHEGRPAGLQKAKEAGIPVIAYDRLIEDPDVLYITFDNVAVGKRSRPRRSWPRSRGQLRPHQGRPGRPERSTFLPQGMGRGRPQGQGRRRRDQDPQRAGRTYTGRLEDREGPDRTWKRSSTRPSDGTKIDAILAENDSMASASRPLTAKSYGYPRSAARTATKPTSRTCRARDPDVDVWKNANELGKAAGAAALELCKGTDMASLTLPDGLLDPTVAPAAGLDGQFTTPGATPSARSSCSRRRSPRRT